MSIDTDRVNQLIQDAMAQFTAAYTLGYTKAVVKKIQAETEAEPPAPTWQLAKPIPPPYLKQGWITKQGGLVKNWKKRWFSVDSKYHVEYWKGEKDPVTKDAATGKPKKKPQGEFVCYGYKVKRDDDKEAKEHSLCLKPYYDDDYAKRVWRLQLANSEEYDAWKKMFQECCHNSANPMNPNPQRRYAFELAYMAMEDSSWFYPTGSESEMLAYVVMRRLERLSLDATYASLPENAMKVKMVAKIRTTVGAMMAPPIDAAWKAVQAAIDKAEGPLEEKLRQLTEPLFQAIKAIKDQVQTAFDETVIPMIQKLIAPISDRLLPVVCQPLHKAQKDLIEEFCRHAAEESRGSWHLYWDLRKRESEYDSALEIARAVSSVEELGNLPSVIMDSCFELLEAARCNFSTMERQTNITGTRLLHDCILEQQRILRWLVEVLVLKPFNETLGTAVSQMCDPLEALVPDILKEFLSPSDILKDMGARAMKSAMEACLTAGGQQDDYKSKLTEYFESQGVTVAKSADELKELEEAAKKAPPSYSLAPTPVAAPVSPVAAAASPVATPASPSSSTTPSSATTPSSPPASPSSSTTPSSATTPSSPSNGGMRPSPSMIANPNSPVSNGGMRPSPSMLGPPNTVGPVGGLHPSPSMLAEGRVYRMLNRDGVAIRTGPAFPGERTQQVISFGEMFVADTAVPILHLHTDGRQHQILMYQLADGRGWVHDFDLRHPENPSVVSEGRPTAYRMVNKDSVAIRVKPFYPGERTPQLIAFGEIFYAAKITPIYYKHTDGKHYNMLMYLLVDGRGWVHDFDPNRPDQPTVVVERSMLLPPPIMMQSQMMQPPQYLQHQQSAGQLMVAPPQQMQPMYVQQTGPVQQPVYGQSNPMYVQQQAYSQPNPYYSQQNQGFQQPAYNQLPPHLQQFPPQQNQQPQFQPQAQPSPTSPQNDQSQPSAPAAQQPVQGGQQNYTAGPGPYGQAPVYGDMQPQNPSAAPVSPTGASAQLAQSSSALPLQIAPPTPDSSVLMTQPASPQARYATMAPAPASPFYQPMSPVAGAPFHQPYGGTPQPYGGTPQPYGGTPQPYGGTPVVGTYGGSPIMSLTQPAGTPRPSTMYVCTNGEGVAMRKRPAFPGEKTGAVIAFNEKFLVVSTTVVQHVHNGVPYPITFYELADGRGWVHNFSVNQPGIPIVSLA